MEAQAGQGRVVAKKGVKPDIGQLPEDTRKQTGFGKIRNKCCNT
jgi:hypothetical protein